MLRLFCWRGLGLWEPYSGGLMYPARDLRHLPRKNDKNAPRFLHLRCENRPPEYGSHRPMVGAGPSRSRLRTRSLQLHKLARGYLLRTKQAARVGVAAAADFSQHRIQKTLCVFATILRQVPRVPSRVHEADAATPTLAAALTNRRLSERYKINSTSRNVHGQNCSKG
jgi:hypothetical protein